MKNSQNNPEAGLNNAPVNNDTTHNDNNAKLLNAASRGDIETVKTLLAHGADVNHANNDGETALLIANERGHTEIVKLLLTQGANINKIDGQGFTALTVSIATGMDIELVRFLLEKGAATDGIVDEASGIKSKFPLIEAVSAGDIEIVKLLLEKGTNINQIDGQGFTALTVSIRMDMGIELVQFLLEKGATIDGIVDEASGIKSRSPLLEAVSVGDIEIAKLLLEKGANINQIDGQGLTALTVSIAMGKDIELVRFLLEKGAATDGIVDEASGIKSRSPLLEAVSVEDIAIVKLLLAHGADVNGVYNDGETALISSAIKGNMEIVNLLIETPNINVNALNPEGLRAIDIIAERGRLEPSDIITLLRNNGSVEPKKPISWALEKIVIKDNVPPDILENRENTKKMLPEMYEKFPLTEQQIDQAIVDFKGKVGVPTIHATSVNEKWTPGQSLSLSEVIDAVVALRPESRMPQDFDFKKFIGTVLYIADQNENMWYHLVYTLQNIRMCAFSKVIHILSTIQDVVIQDVFVIYEHKSIAEFIPYYNEVLRTMEYRFGFDTPKAVAHVIDALNRRVVPEDMNGLTQKTFGVFNEVFSNMYGREDEALLDTYHFKGLHEKIIPFLSNAVIDQNQQDLKEWYQVFNQAILDSANVVFNKLTGQDVTIEGMTEMLKFYSNSILGQNLDKVPFALIVDRYNDILTNKGIDFAKAFAELLDKEFLFGDDANVKKLLDHANNLPDMAFEYVSVITEENEEKEEEKEDDPEDLTQVMSSPAHLQAAEAAALSGEVDDHTQWSDLD